MVKRVSSVFSDTGHCGRKFWTIFVKLEIELCSENCVVIGDLVSARKDSSLMSRVNVSLTVRETL